MRLILLAILPVLAADHLARAQDIPSELQPRLFTLQGNGLGVAAALDKLEQATGNRVVDRRKLKATVTIDVDLTQATFWRALDAIARAADASVALYEADGQIALVDRSARKTAAVYTGLFRLTPKKTVVTRDEDTGVHSCAVHVEVAWEPRFQPLYLEIGSKAGPVSVVFAPDAGGKSLKAGLPPRSQLPVAGRNVVEDILRLPAPARSAPKIASLKGAMRVIGPTKMLAFAFNGMKADTQKQDGVTVELRRAPRDPWSVDVLIANPPGGPRFESYQSWLDNNTIHLERGEGADRQVVYPNAADEQELEPTTALSAAIRYRFRAKGGAPAGKPDDWRLVYRTPGPIVALDVPFEFKDLPLP